MRDGAAKGLLKQLVALTWMIELGIRRRVHAFRERPRWRLAGSCNGCGRCCVESPLRVGLAIWYLPLLRTLFLGWQRRVNGFEFLRQERQGRFFVFRCTHYDPETRRCDSYATRPAMCRDYPRALLAGAWPELFPECGFEVKARRADGMRGAIDGLDLPEDEKAELKRKLRL